jgi:hypothetical protein
VDVNKSHEDNNGEARGKNYSVFDKSQGDIAYTSSSVMSRK